MNVLPAMAIRRIVNLAVVASLALALVACAQKQALQAQAPAPKPAEEGPGQIDSATMLPPNVEPVRTESVAADVQAQGIAPRQSQVQTLPANPSPDTYAFRNDARQLAAQLAQQHGLDADWVWQAIAHARYKESVTRFIMPPPPGTPKNWTVYRSRFVEPIRIRAGVQFWREHRETLDRAEAKYGVPASVIVGVLGVETIYGRQMGGFRALDALTTLSLDFPRGRSDRSEFFKAELGHYLKWCQDIQVNPESVQASYAGAIGMPQFMPSSIRRLAIDFDGDGRIDLTRSAADAIGSVAHYLAKHGWVPRTASYFELSPPADAEELKKLVEPDILPTFTADELREAGVKLSDEGQAHVGKLALVALQNGDAPPLYVGGTANFYAITRYNQSSYYALAVAQLGEAVRKEAEKLTQANK